jgi:phenylalanyl-tRNA synthetase beta chain
MKFSHSWLKEYVAIAEPPERVGERLTDAGIPLDGIEGSGDGAVYDFDILTNRPDCMNHLGLGREYAALIGAALHRPAAPIPRGGRPTPEIASVAIEAPDLCARYAARCVTGIRIGPSPDWLRRRLESIGQRPISNIVDVTNFVLWEAGQPLHPFDLERLEGRSIVVRRARAGETLKTLDGVERRLTPEMLVIADARRPVALAGIMGGEATAIGPATRDILLESAWFDPVSVRRTARALGLRTDASHRFERGADPEAAVAVLDRAAALISGAAGGAVSDPAIDVHPRPESGRVVRFRPQRARALLGGDLDEAVMLEALERREFVVEARGAPDWRVRAPSFRRDIEREADLIEEVARHRGYGPIPAVLPLLPGAPEGRSREDRRARIARRGLEAAGLSEAVNYVMAEREECALFTPGAEPPALENPLQSQAAHLRTSLLPGLLRNVAHNLNRGLGACHLYEIGKVFRRTEGRPDERARIAFVMAGRGLPAHWSVPRREVDLYDARGAFELAADLLGISPLTFTSARIPFLEEGRALRVFRDDVQLGHLGEIAPAVLERFGIDRPVFAGDAGLEELCALPAGGRRYAPLPRFPAVRRDLAFVVDQGVGFEAIEKLVRRTASLPIAEVQAFDRYRGSGVPEGCVSLAIQVVFQHPDRTLLAEEIQEAQEAIVAALRAELGARLRGATEPGRAT